jgi:hypothetical protein
MRMTAGVHRNTAHCRTPSEPASTPCFAQLDIAMIGVANLTDGRHAAFMNQANFTAGQAHLSVNTLFRQ